MSELLGNVFRPGEKGALYSLTLDGDSLVATPRSSEQGQAIRFPLRDEFLSFGGDAGSQVVLKNPEGATLYAERASLEPALAGAGGRHFQERMKTEGKRVVKANRLALAVFFGFFLGCGLLLGLGVWIMNWGVDRMVDRIPISWEESLGDLVVESGIGPEVDDPRVVEPVQAVLNRLVAADSRQPYKMKLHVVESEQLNAFAAPGGQIVVFTGLLKKTESPDELAGVLAHELQHVYKRHGLRNMVHSIKWQVIAALVIGDVGSVQQVILAKAPEFLSLSYGRSLEEEADLEGIELLCRAHLEPKGMVDFFHIMRENETGVSPPEFMNSHPDTGNRIENLQEWIEKHSACDPQPLELDWAELKSALEHEKTPARSD